MTECSFKLIHYKDVLKRALKLGYQLSSFKNYPKVSNAKKVIILRHDIDLDIARALEMARIEKDLRISATYFVRLHAKDYNPFECKAHSILKQILSMDHEIGLHTEALDVSLIMQEDAKDVFKREKAILESILKTKIVSAAQHGNFTIVSQDPKNHFFLQHKQKDVGIKFQPFEKRFCRDMKYISDSLGTWREGCLCQHISTQNKLQVLTHPNYWFYEHYLTR